MPSDTNNSGMNIIIGDDELGSVILDLLPINGNILAVAAYDGDDNVVEIHLDDLPEASQEAAWDRYWRSFETYFEDATYH